MKPAPQRSRDAVMEFMVAMAEGNQLAPDVREKFLAGQMSYEDALVLFREHQSG